jgi:hypothetical protein
MRYKRPSDKERVAWEVWLLELPEFVRVVAEKFDPWTLYRLKTTSQRVVVVSIDEHDDKSVTLTVLVSGEFNFVSHERKVFGIKPEDLEECDLPKPGELLGSLDAPIGVCKDLFEEVKKKRN